MCLLASLIWHFVCGPNIEMTFIGRLTNYPGLHRRFPGYRTLSSGQAGMSWCPYKANTRLWKKPLHPWQHMESKPGGLRGGLLQPSLHQRRMCGWQDMTATCSPAPWCLFYALLLRMKQVPQPPRSSEAHWWEQGDRSPGNKRTPRCRNWAAESLQPSPTAPRCCCKQTSFPEALPLSNTKKSPTHSASRTDSGALSPPLFLAHDSGPSGLEIQKLEGLQGRDTDRCSW